MSDLAQLISAKELEIQQQQARMTSFKTSAINHRNEANSRSCKGTRKQKEACEKEKQRLLVVASQRDQEAANIQKSIERLTSEKNALQSALDAKNQADINLSKHGLSNDALIEKAKAEAKADALAAEIEASAKARAIDAKSKADSETQSQTNMIVFAVIGVVVLLAAGFGIMKLKAMKNGK